MGVYLQGTPVAISYTFTLANVPTDPSTVIFRVRDPNGITTVYEYGVVGAVTNPGVGRYVLNILPTVAGDYHYRVEGSGTIAAVDEGEFTIVASSVLGLGSAAAAGPTLGPCASWIDGDNVAACCAPLSVGSDGALLDEVAVQASMLLYELSGRRFPGVCTATVRPCRDHCGCFGLISAGWHWSAGGYYGDLGGHWLNECGDRCGCGSLSSVPLAGYPVRDVLSVKIDGQTVDPSSYRVDRWRELVRLDDAETDPATPRTWPACQNLALDDTEEGTFSVTYAWGVEPPPLGREAAAQLACQLALACGVAGSAGAVCQLPTGVTKVTREGITIERGLLASFLRPGQTGLVLVDAFLSTYNPRGLSRAPAVFSPDLRRYPRRITA